MNIEHKTFSEGNETEIDLLGEVHYEDGEKQPKYLPYWEAVKHVREHQNDHPTDPSAKFASEVLMEIERILDAEGKVKYYTAVGSVLDFKHGVDAWFELEDGTMATIDLTTGRSKGKETTDIDFPVPAEGLRSEKFFRAHVEALAQRVVDVFAQSERLVRAG